MTECVALIPARAGSKRLPGKNTRPLGGRPLIAWSIEAALAARSVTRIIVSTDSKDIADIACRCGAEIPFIRPQHLGGDTTTSRDVMRHALDWLKESEGDMPTWLILLQPTSPFRTADDIDTIMGEMKGSGADSGLSVTEAIAPQLTMIRDASGALQYLSDANNQLLRRQEMRDYYRADGALYVVRPETFIQRDTLLGHSPYGYLMPKLHSLDIDTADDMELAEIMVRGRANRK